MSNTLHLRWALAGAVAGTVARAAHPYTLVLTGLVFGLCQWLVLRQQLQRRAWLAAALWVPASALGGLVAYLLIASWGVRHLGPPLIALAAPYENLASHLIFLTALWAAIGLAQWPLLRQRYRHAGWWVPVSAAGGAAGALADIVLELAGGAMHGTVLAGALAGAAYGAVTGAALAHLAAGEP
ncbi:MAG TPA: hypothetical protein VNL77_10020 [Roseiflexaceae bacterium]|nr:hypothetical protein [Roseiflexaceae bacterium]